MSGAFSNLRGVFYAVTGYTVWVLSDASLKFIGGSSLPKYEIAFFMSIGALFSTGVITAMRGKLNHLKPRHKPLLVVLGVLLAANIFAYFVAYEHLSLVNLYSVTFLGPLLTALLAFLFMGERVRKAQVLAILAGFAGVVIAIDPFHALRVAGNGVGYTAAFVILFVNTIYLLIIRQYGQGEHHESLAFYPRFGMLLTGLGAFLFLPFVPFTATQLFVMLGAGVFAGIGWIFITVASQRMPASLVAPYRYSQIVMGAVLGYALWQDVPTMNCVIGSLVIIVSGLLSAHQARRLEVAV